MTQETVDQIVREMRQLDDAVYFGMPEVLPGSLGTAVRTIADGAIRIGAPAKVDVSKRDVLPLLVVSGDSEARRGLCPPELNSSVIAIDLWTGASRVVNAFPIDPSKTGSSVPGSETPRPRTYPKDGVQRTGASRFALAMGAEITGKVWLDAFALELVPKAPGQWALRALTFDRLSNAAIVQCLDPKTPHLVPGLHADVAAEIEADARRAHANPSEGRSFLRTAATPALGASGCALAMPGEIQVGAKHLPVHAAASLRVGAGMLVDPERFADPAKVGKVDEHELPRAVATVAIVLAELDLSPPRLIQVHVPCSGKFAAGDAIEIAFELDLAELTGPLREGPCYVWLLAGDRASAPHRLDVVVPK